MTDANLVAWFPMTKGSSTTLYDYSGNANNGTITGATWEKEKTGQYSLQYAGGSDNVNIDGGPVIAGSLTWSIWINSPTGGTGHLISNTDAASAGYRTLLSTIASGTSFIVFDDAGTDFTVNAPISVVDTWEHYVVTLDVGNYISIYKNGIFVAQTSISGSTFNTTDNGFEIGNAAYTGTAAYNGKIMNVIIYDRVLSLNEVKDLYKKTYIE